MKGFNKFSQYTLNANNGVMTPGFAGVPNNFDYSTAGNSGTSGPMQTTLNKQNTGGTQGLPVPPDQVGNPNATRDGDPNTQKGPSPLDKFKGIFNNPEPKKDAKGNVIPEPDTTPAIFSAKPEDLQKSIKDKVDVSSLVTPELMKGILGPNASADQQKNFTGFANSLAQTILLQATQVAIGVTKQGMEAGVSKAKTSTIQEVTQNAAVSAIQQAFPSIAGLPFAGQVVERIMAHTPNASVDEIKKQATEYFKSINIQEADPTKNNSSAGEDPLGLGGFFKGM
jgi:hypothetical protein